MAWVNICDIVYPVGAYYISHDSTPPGELFGELGLPSQAGFYIVTRALALVEVTLIH